MQANGSDRRFQFVGNGVDKAVVLLAAPNLAHQKGGVHDHARDDQRKEDDAEKQQHALAPVENDPSDIEGNRQRHQANAQAEEEDDSSAAARDAHGVRLILPRSRLRVVKASKGRHFCRRSDIGGIAIVAQLSSLM